MASEERRRVLAHFQCQIPAMVPALALAAHWLHIPDDCVRRCLGNPNAGDIRRKSSQHVDMRHDLAVVRRVEIKWRSSERRPPGDLASDGYYWHRHDDKDACENSDYENTRQVAAADRGRSTLGRHDFLRARRLYTHHGETLLDAPRPRNEHLLEEGDGVAVGHAGNKCPGSR